MSLQAQQLEHVAAYDVTFSIPASEGSLAEIHDFAKLPSVAHKIVAFLDNQWLQGYSHQSLMTIQSPITCGLEFYNAQDLPLTFINTALGIVRRIQEVHYMLGRRA